MAIDDKIKALTKQLYPTGRVWRINPNSIKEKFVNGLLASEIRAYNDAVSILDSTIADNPNFSVDDAAAWEKRLGLPDGTGVPLQQRMDAINVQLNWPGTNPAKGAADYIQAILQAAGYNVCVHENLVITNPGEGGWILKNGAITGSFQSITFGNNLFVAVGNGGIVMTSPDGSTWTSRTVAASNTWRSVCFGNNLFVAVSNDGAGNRVMTSPDGITWTSRVSAADNSWNSVCFGNNLFVAVSQTGAGNRVMTSPDGITWTIQVSASDLLWQGVTYGNSVFVAVSSLNGNNIMTSPDGITWTLRAGATSNAFWGDIAFGNSTFVVVSSAATGTNNVMTSHDGITWTMRVGASSNSWRNVTFGNGIFVAIAGGGSSDDIHDVMVSANGISWTSVSTPSNNGWSSVIFGNSTFVAVSQTGFPTNVMISSGGYNYQTYAQFAGINLVRHISTLLHGQQRHGYLSKKGIIIANSVDSGGDDTFDIGDGSDTIFIGGCPPGTFVNIPKAQEAAFRQFILKIKPVNVTVLLLVNFV